MRTVGRVFKSEKEENGLNSKSKKELLEMATEAGLLVNDKMSKTEIIECIVQSS